VIVETLVTTLDAAGAVNVAPMGVAWDAHELVLQPFLETATWRNLVAVPSAVVHLTDDVLLLARAALGPVEAPMTPARRVRGAVLADACSWREVEVVAVDATPPRARVVTRVVAEGRGREFLGLNRARHAVLEVTILATRTHLLPAEEIRAAVARHQPLVEKTAGPREREAWAFVLAELERRLAAPAGSAA